MKEHLVLALVVVTLIVIAALRSVDAQPNKTRYVSFTWEPPLATEDGIPIIKDLSYDIYLGQLKGNKPPSYYKYGSTSNTEILNAPDIRKGCFASYVVAYYTDEPELRSRASKNQVFCVGR